MGAVVPALSVTQNEIRLLEVSKSAGSAGGRKRSEPGPPQQARVMNTN